MSKRVCMCESEGERESEREREMIAITHVQNTVRFVVARAKFFLLVLEK